MWWYDVTELDNYGLNGSLSAHHTDHPMRLYVVQKDARA